MSSRRHQQRAKVVKWLQRRNEYDATSAWLGGLAESLVADAQLEDEALEELEQRLRGHYGAEYTKIGDDHDAHIGFWEALATAFPTRPRLRAILADTLLISGRDRARCLQEFLAAVALAPALFPEFAGDFYEVAQGLGRASWLDYRLAELRFAACDDDEDHEYTQSLTRDLLMEFGTDPATIARIKACARARAES